MGWKNILVNQKSTIKVRQNYLYIKNDEKEARIPIEDISSIVFGNTQISISIEVLSRLVAEKSSIIITDSKHLPAGTLVPYASYHRPLEITNQQLSCKSPLKRKIWKKIIIQKTKNQDAHLALLGLKKKLVGIGKSIKSGDPDNKEAQAAKIYWAQIMNRKRSSKTLLNGALNYSYAIVRSHLARIAASKGLLGHLGIHHRGPCNPFNLADDLIEPFRPLIDRYTFAAIGDCSDDFLSPKRKIELIGVLEDQCLIADVQYSISQSINTVIDSLIQCMRQNDSSFLILPEMAHG